MSGPSDSEEVGRSNLIFEVAFFLSGLLVGGVLDVIARLVYDNFTR